MTIPLPICAPGEEAWPTETGYVCGPADPAIPEEMDQSPDPLPEPLPLTPPPGTSTGTVSPLPDVLAETGPSDDVLAGLLAVAAILCVAGVTVKVWAEARRSESTLRTEGLL